MARLSYVHPIIPYWNAAVRTGFFLLGVYLLSALHTAWLDEKQLARTDFLTGVANRRYFFELANSEIKRAQRYLQSFVISYVDVDDFKAVNDRFGHNQGDALLRLAAQTVKSSIRGVDIVARLGGDEFAVLLPETGHASAAEVMQRVRANLMNAMTQNKWPVTFSIGTVTYLYPPVSVDEMIKTADSIMYAVKQTGKNTIKYEVLGKPS
jgi:diguanylate cyclase (GGDEF)-like protein